MFSRLASQVREITCSDSRAQFLKQPPHHCAHIAKPVPPVCRLILAADPRVANAKGRALSCSSIAAGVNALARYANSTRHMCAKIQTPRRGPPLCVYSFIQANVTCDGWRKHNIHRHYNVCCSYSAERQISKNPKNNCLVNDTFKCTKITVT